ncbi:MAG: hypothetical protein IKL84_03115 [Clostridia bacterium]|nr:hypothetical protein [Clostridia bacterium]
MNDIMISGSGVVSGGEYNKINIAGSGRISGDVECREFRASGSVKADGNIRCAGVLKCSGSMSADGDLEAADTHVSGALKCGGSLRGGDIHVYGGLKVAGGMYGNEVHISGGVKVEKDIEAELVKMASTFKVGGTINAEKVEITLAGGADSSVESLVGGEISVEPGRSAKSKLNLIIFRFGSLSPVGFLKAGLIEGDTVCLENTAADVVRGGKVVIGEGCKIGRVEYSESFEAAAGAEIGVTEKI